MSFVFNYSALLSIPIVSKVIHLLRHHMYATTDTSSLTSRKFIEDVEELRLTGSLNPDFETRQCLRLLLGILPNKYQVFTCLHSPVPDNPSDEPELTTALREVVPSQYRRPLTFATLKAHGIRAISRADDCVAVVFRTLHGPPQ